MDLGRINGVGLVPFEKARLFAHAFGGGSFRQIKAIALPVTGGHVKADAGGDAPVFFEVLSRVPIGRTIAAQSIVIIVAIRVDANGGRAEHVRIGARAGSAETAPAFGPNVFAIPSVLVIPLGRELRFVIEAEHLARAIRVEIALRQGYFEGFIRRNRISGIIEKTP